MESNQTITISLGSKKGDVSITKLAEVLSNYQTLLFCIGEYLEKKSPRKSGDYSKKVKESCELKIRKVAMGSVKLELHIPKPVQETLQPVSLGEQALDLSNKLAQDIASENYSITIPELIPDTINRKRILEIFEKVIPENEDEYLEIGISEYKKTLSQLHKKRVEEIMPVIKLPQAKRVTGRLMELRVDDKRRFQVDTVEGIIHGEYTVDVEKFFKTNIGKLVTLEGKTNPKEPKLTLVIDERSNYKLLDHYSLTDFSFKSVMKKFAKPLDVEVNYENESYLIYEPSFKLLTSTKTFKEGVRDLQGQFAILWKEYVAAPDFGFSDGAKKLRKRLLQSVE